MEEIKVRTPTPKGKAGKEALKKRLEREKLRRWRLFRKPRPAAKRRAKDNEDGVGLWSDT